MAVNLKLKKLKLYLKVITLTAEKAKQINRVIALFNNIKRIFVRHGPIQKR